MKKTKVAGLKDQIEAFIRNLIKSECQQTFTSRSMLRIGLFIILYDLTSPQIND